MNHLINSVITWSKAHKTVIAVALGLFIVLVLWLAGINLINKASNWFYDRGTTETHKEIQGLKNEAQKLKQVAAAALEALELEKKVTEQERKKREIAEGILADKTLTTNEKLKKYEEAMQLQPVVSPPADTDELCRRAAALGIDCGD